MEPTSSAVRDVLLKRQGLVFPQTRGQALADKLLDALDVELAQLGFVLSTRLRKRLRESAREELGQLKAWLCTVLAAQSGANHRHQPLFRNFPDGVPDDTHQLWVQRVVVHFLQREDQPCLFCTRTGTTHVLSPCTHVVCSHCFDPSNYAACPVCGGSIDTRSPFCKPSAKRPLPNEHVTFKLVDLGEDVEQAARELFVRLCERKQALSPNDKTDLTVLVKELRERTLGWLPSGIPVRENVALIFGTLLTSCPPAAVMSAATRYLTSAPDVLRLLAVYSGADPGLQAQITYRRIIRIEQPARWWGKIAQMLGAQAPTARGVPTHIPIQLRRFRVAKLSRPLRREVLQLLESFGQERLVEDMLRHRSYWVWMGEFLHPHEYAKRFPKVAHAFAVLRKKAPDGTPAPIFRGYYAKLEAAAAARDSNALLSLLKERPGELARRFDHALRVADGDAAAIEQLLQHFAEVAPAFSTPVLLTLYRHLPHRTKRAKLRVYWPKGAVTKGVSAVDGRRTLAQNVVDRALASVERELLARFAKKPTLDTCVVDTALRDVIAPFNERTASPAAVALPRGSRISVPPSKAVRMFIHWCEPEKRADDTDVDLSVGLYDADWKNVGVCSYYSLKLSSPDGKPIVSSSGDFTSAPYPDGASEFIDLHRERALAAGFRYAVMVINAYSGMPFSLLERAFAGLMLREDLGGKHFDPRTVELKFSMQGDHGIFMPLVFDLQESTMHWLDVYSTGQLHMNNVANSNAAISRICPELIEYFASGVRTTMLDLGLLHAAARAQRVWLRGAENMLFVREADEDGQAFLRRLRSGLGARTAAPPQLTDASLLLLYRGDLDVPDGALAYALFRERVTPNLSASDLIS